MSYDLSVLSGKSKKGFTLIELMVVIAIIGLLTAILFANFTNIQKRSRDGQRKTDLRTIQHALELYRADQGSYPTGIYGGTNCPAGSPNGLCSTSSSVYMQKVPGDNQGTNYWNCGNYWYSSASPYTTYTLSACLENTSDNDPNTGGLPSGAPAAGCTATCASGKYYTVMNP